MTREELEVALHDARNAHQVTIAELYFARQTITDLQSRLAAMTDIASEANRDAAQALERERLAERACDVALALERSALAERAHHCQCKGGGGR